MTPKDPLPPHTPPRASVELPASPEATRVIASPTVAVSELHQFLFKRLQDIYPRKDSHEIAALVEYTEVVVDAAVAALDRKAK